MIILHNPDDNNTLWQFISDTTAQKTRKSWKIKVPKRQTLTVSFKSILSNLNKLSPVFIKFQKLIFDKNLILKLKAGNKIVIELSQWINSSTEKADLTLLEIERPDGYEDKQDISWDDYESHLEQCGTELYQFSMNGITNRNSLCHIYPWADFRLDLAFYQNYHESDEIVKDNDWDELTDIPFYCDEEVKVYRYELDLNEYGETFIEFFDLFDGTKQFKINFGNR